MEYGTAAPLPALAEFMENSWLLINHSDVVQSVALVPNRQPDILTIGIN